MNPWSWRQRLVDVSLILVGVLAGLVLTRVLFPCEPRQIVWQEMPKMAWQKSDGSPCDAGYIVECSLLEAGSMTVTVKESHVTDAGVYESEYDWSSLCACRVVRK